MDVTEQTGLGGFVFVWLGFFENLHGYAAVIYLG